MRGVQKLYSPYFNNEKPTSEGRGRSVTLIERRDRKLIFRYYFYTQMKRLNFEQTIVQLTVEFDIAERTITDRLQKYNEFIAKIMRQKPSVIELKKEYPYFSWS